MKQLLFLFLLVGLSVNLRALDYATDATLTGSTTTETKNLGIKFHNTSGAPVPITHLSRYNYPGNNQIHPLRIYATSDPASLVETVYCDASLGVAGTFQAIPLAAPYVVPIGGSCVISSGEGGGDSYNRQINGSPVIQNHLTGRADIGWTLATWVEASSMVSGGVAYAANGPVSFSYSGPVRSWTYNPATHEFPTNGSVYDVKSAAGAAVPGDKIIIPAGTYTYGEGATSITVPAGVTIEGEPGAIINMHTGSPTGYGSGIFFLSEGSIVRGLTINGPNAVNCIPFQTSANDWAVLDNTYNQYPGRGSYFINVNRSTRGVVAGNVIFGGAGNSEMVYSRGPLDSWDTDDTLGGADNIFIEDNQFSGDGYINDANANARAVVRGNVMLGQFKADIHGAQTSSDAGVNRGGRHMEVYLNWWISTAAGRAIEFRSGTGRLWGNFVAQTGGGYVQIHEYKVFQNTGLFYPRYQTAYDYPIRDQVGRGKYATPGNSATATSEPVYYWGNRKGASTILTFSQNAIPAGSQTQYATDTGIPGATYTWEQVIQNDRDIFKEVASFDGSTGIGMGTREEMDAITPSKVGVGFAVKNEGSWNQKFSGTVSVTTLRRNDYCEIVSLGNTNWQDMGAPPGATTGTQFNPTGPGAGTGTAKPAHGQVLYIWDGDSWNLDYTPYTYPHPIRALAAEPSEPTGPTITTQPSDLSVVAGSPASLSVSATTSGGALTYQWRKAGVSVGGATSSTYTISSPALGDAGSFDVVVSDDYGTATSNSATLIVNPPDVTPETNVYSGAARSFASGVFN